MGRRKIEIQPLGDDRNRTVTFVKRKAGLFKKAYELSVLCKVDLAVIIVGNNNKVYEFSSVDTKELMDFYLQQTPYEQKLPENYGRYKKKTSLQSRLYSMMDEEAMLDIKLEDGNADSDYESDTPEPKRQRKTSPAPMMYSKQASVNTRFGQPSAQQNSQNPLKEADAPPQRPVLRVQIPSDSKRLTSESKTITPVESTDLKQEQKLTEAQGAQTQTLNSALYSFGKFKSPEVRKQVHQLPFPINKLQTLSPSSGAMPQLPINSGMQFFPPLPQPSPSGQYHPSILPTPVFNQVFNQQYMGQAAGQTGQNGQNVPGEQGGPSGQNVQAQNAAAQAQGQVQANQAQATQAQDASATAMQQNPGDGGGMEGAAPRLKPPFQLNGDQTPVSGLPSRYMSDIFPSPSNLYASQEWPTGMTPYGNTNMSHYFVNMIPSASGQTPMSMTAVFANAARNSYLTGVQRPQVAPTQQPLMLENQEAKPE